MAGNLAEERIDNTGWAYLHNNKNVVALKKSGGSESLTDKNTAITQLSTLTTVPYRAETLVLSGFAGGGVSNFKPHKAFTYIIQKCNRLNVFKRNTS